MVELFERDPSDSGAAFILAQHLDPGDPSHSAEILDRDTAMSVVEARDGMSIEADHVYVAPPGASVTVAGDAGRPGAEPSDRRAVRVHRRRAGLGRCRDRPFGGRQQYDSMPRNAIATGCADVIRPAPELADAVVSYLRRLGRGRNGTWADDLEPRPPEKLETVLEVVWSWPRTKRECHPTYTSALCHAMNSRPGWSVSRSGRFASGSPSSA